MVTFLNFSCFYFILYFVLVSHLCDTRGCLRPEHIIDESQDANLSRRRCAGMIIGIRNDTITGIAPCHHGVERATPNGNPFEFTCRKVRAIFHCYRACAYIDSLNA